MDLESLLTTARHHGASDLHLEPGLGPALRIRGNLRMLEGMVSAADLQSMAHQLIGEADWPAFQERRSADLSRTLQGIRCRFNLFHTTRGIGLAARLLSSFQATLDSLNLHPDLRKLVAHSHGLILVSGPTGSGKTSTLAALIQEINQTESRHIVTIESPIEYTFRPRHAFIRQREVGRDTPSFEQALLDALREDPDVLMVGEMRDPETMRLTLNASETGHLVLATVHSSTCAEALQRIVSAFPAEIQSGVCAQLADSLVAVISQRLHFRADLQLRLPECEILTATHAVRNYIRTREFFKIASALEMGAEHGMWSLSRYRSWIDSRRHWVLPSEAPELEAGLPSAGTGVLPLVSPAKSRPVRSSEPTRPAHPSNRRIEIEPGETDFGPILSR